ncbi:predicted protein [Nematostella vectensis]|uniref:Protein-tyrosine sulfotransferase n=1 Tax=Nematostella vectensis TaxID=45351 RepID=A7SXA5_NEMVE|nr:uncharacterized protein LOC5502602 [Nematostella vectensis]EDO31662.1 predicted protein [Nematostella vectensis]|eukprot:XP_001623762.1 predicted protein [Nematostella vectensis]
MEFKPRRVVCWLVITILVALLLWYQTGTQANSTHEHINKGRLSRVSSKVPQDVPLARRKVYDQVETFLIFIGYPRSGHTLVGSLIDAHPNAIIANELDIIGSWLEWNEDHRNKYFLFDQLYKNSHEQTLKGFRSSSVKHRFNYSVRGQWQGRFDRTIKVIGDKKGGGMTARLTNQKQAPILARIKNKIKVKFKFIHVVRNPFDNIATMTTRDKDKTSFKSQGKLNDTDALEQQIFKYFVLAAGNQRLIQRRRKNVLEIHSKDMISKPRDTLRRICKLLDLTCSKQYLYDCASIVYKEPSKTRFRVVWTDKQKQRTLKAMRRFAFLKGYTFDSL